MSNKKKLGSCTSNKISHPAHVDEPQEEAAAPLLQQERQSKTTLSSSGSSTVYAYRTEISIA